ncbi:MAG: sulfatase-like hydrolase/transferase [Verrucomicrobiales bacterium]|nr:sulfatase-like hydrolase/transferase [Verrucomicrobiales bacterium]
MFAALRAIVVLSLSFLPILPTRGQDRPNILWLSAEDISAHLGCYGDPHAITPNLDALAAQGVRYTKAFTTAGVCAPCRSGIITGMYQNSIGTHHMRCDAVLPGWLKPFPLYLREAGYYCTNNVKTDYQFSQPTPKEIWDEVSNTAHWKNRPTGKPFFAVFNYTGCHESGIADVKKYHEVTKDLDPSQRQDPAKLTTLPPYYPDTSAVREDWKRSYELITAMDVWAGKLIAELKEAGEWENTVVMFWSDHGTGLPRRKRWLYDSGTHIPLIVHFPAKIRAAFATKAPGESDDRLVSSVDFAPTLLTLAGVAVPAHLQGQPFLGEEKRGFVFGARDRMDERYDVIRTARDGRWRYVRNFEPLKPATQFINTCENGTTMKEIRKAMAAGTMPDAAALYIEPQKPVEELYDLETDPHEVHNLAADPAHAGKLSELREALAAWQLEIGDLGLVPESEIKHREKSAGSAFAILHGSGDRAKLVKDLSAAAARASGGPKGIDAMLSGLGHTEAAVRYWSATGLGNYPAETKAKAGSAADLSQALEDKSPAVSIAAARALCRMGLTSKGLALLEKRLSDKNEWARLEAAIVLDELDDIARPVLAAMKSGLEEQPNKYIIRVLNKAVNDLEGTAREVP